MHTAMPYVLILLVVGLTAAIGYVLYEYWRERRAARRPDNKDLFQK